MSIETLKKQISELEMWKASKEKQQIKYPLDIKSVEIRQNSFRRRRDPTTQIFEEAIIVRTQKSLHTPILFTDAIGLGLGVSWKNQSRFVRAMRAIYPFTADATTDVLSSPHPVSDGDSLVFASTGTLPAPLDTATSYIVTNSTGTTFKLSGVDILNTGSGTHYFSV